MLLNDLLRRGLLAFSLAQVANAACPTSLIDDWASESRLTFLNYNALIRTSGADGTMTLDVNSVDNRVTLTPKSKASSYFYSLLDCTDVQDTYGGISMRVNAPSGSSFEVGLKLCGADDEFWVYHSTQELGWTFDGTEKLFSIDFNNFRPDSNTKFSTIILDSLSSPIVLGPMAFYCGDSPSEYIVSPYTPEPEPSGIVPTPSGTAPPLVIDRFGNEETNALGFWHGVDEGMSLIWGEDSLTINPGQSGVSISDFSDYTMYSQVSGSCRDLTDYKSSYLHIAYQGSTSFSVALLEHNEACDETLLPYPQTWDSLEASRYASASDIYIPMDHFHINHTRAVGISLKGFYSVDPTTFSKIEIVPSVPEDFSTAATGGIPAKAPSGNLVFACKRPNSFAFAIDDGEPGYAQRVMDIIEQEGIKVTFFTVGAALRDPTNNLSALYETMKTRGHQIALHSYTHPKMEGLSDYSAIDWEINNDIKSVSEAFDGLHTPYFRPPFGNEGARMRQRLALALALGGTDDDDDEDDDAYIVNWSVDVEDWLWGESDTPEKQLEAFQRDVDKGGNLVVMHYLYNSTVEYLPELIRIAKESGKQLMRVDQCMMDPNAPPL